MWHAVLVAVVSLIAVWVAFLAYFLIASRETSALREAASLLPDTLRLVRRLAMDRTIPRSARIPVWLLVAYLASPIDFVPDFLPVIGYADDLILTAVVLRRLMHRAGPEKVAEHWPGSAEGLRALRRTLRLQEER